MNKIRFDSPFNKEEFIRSNKLFWNYLWNRRKKQVLQGVIFFIILLVLGILTGTKRSEGFNPYLFAAGLIFCVTAAGAIEMFFSWKKHNKAIQNMADKYENSNSMLITEISDDSIEISDFESCVNLEWSEFNFYTIYKESILLIPKNRTSRGLVINKENDGAEKYGQMLELLKDKLTYRKFR